MIYVVTDFVRCVGERCSVDCDSRGCLEPIVKAPRLCWALHTEHLHPSRGGGRGFVRNLAGDDMGMVDVGRE